MDNTAQKTNKKLKRTTEQFIELLKEKYGNKYDFSKIVYTGISNKVAVICPMHGEFYIRANDLLNGHGCPLCSGTKKLTTQEFIERARKIHGSKYDYSLSDYKNSSTPIKIICHEKDENGIEHGIFLQTPRNHLQGDRCPKCYRSFKKTTEEFIIQAKQIHGDKYDYSKVNYQGNKKPIIIICPKHGEFIQTPLYHLQGHGCQKCYYEKGGISRRIGTEKFIEKAKEIHGNKYNYNKVNYVNSKTKVIITCPKHGDFLMTPSKHVSSKQGCPICSESHMENETFLALTSENIKVERQKKFEWLKLKYPLSLDFYLPYYNIAIECQGEQHYRSFNFFKERSNVESNKARDELKYKLCSEHGIKMLYLTHSMSILKTSNIYNEENTFTSIKKLIEKIKHEILFEKIIKDVLNNLYKTL